MCALKLSHLESTYAGIYQAFWYRVLDIKRSRMSSLPVYATVVASQLHLP